MASPNYQSGLEVAGDTKSYQYVAPTPTAPPPQPYYTPEAGAAAAGQHHHHYHEAAAEKTICGVRRATFWLSFALIFVIIASGIGGGVGGTLAVKSAKDSLSKLNCGSGSGTGTGSDTNPQTVYITTTRTRTATATGTATAASGSSTAGIIVPTDGYTYLDCPSQNRTSITAFGQTFRIVCGQDSAGPDIIAVVAYSLLDCARACAAYNSNSGSNGCVGATFNSYLRYVDAHKGTCWLKNSTGTPIVNGLTGIDPNTYAQVILQS